MARNRDEPAKIPEGPLKFATHKREHLMRRFKSVQHGSGCQRIGPEAALGASHSTQTVNGLLTRLA